METADDVDKIRNKLTIFRKNCFKNDFKKDK